MALSAQIQDKRDQIEGSQDAKGGPDHGWVDGDQGAGGQHFVLGPFLDGPQSACVGPQRLALFLVCSILARVANASMVMMPPNAFRRRIRGNQCVYCGLSADTEDHFPPQSLTHLGVLLPACRECNSMAGTEWCFDFELRCAYVKDKLRKKYQKVLQTPDWHARS